METLQQMFMTVMAAFAFFILIAKIASAVVINGGSDHVQSTSIRDPSNGLDDQLKSSNKIKSTRKVRFAVDHDVFVASETKSIVFKTNCSEIEEDCGNESTDVDLDELKEGESVLVEGNVGKCDEIEMCKNLLCDDGIDEVEKEKQGLISEEDDSDDDDWEGVERSDLEKVFAMAASYGKLDDNNNNSLQNLESDVQMQLYALHKVATEGPCREAQPMALKISARAKWNAWQKLGNMNQDLAMEQYIALLSELVPGWSQGIHSVDKH